MKFKVGDKVKQVERHMPYSLTYNGERGMTLIADLVGEVTRVLPSNESMYPIEVRFPLEGGKGHSGGWRYAEDEIEVVS